LKSPASRRYILVAGATLSALALQQYLTADAASARPGQGGFVVAEQVTPPADPNDPRQKAKPKRPPAGQAVPTPKQPAVQPKNVTGQPPAGQSLPAAPGGQRKITNPVPPNLQPRNLQPGQAAVPSRQPAAIQPNLQPGNVLPGPTPAARAKQSPPPASGGQQITNNPVQPKITNNPIQPNVQPRNARSAPVQPVTPSQNVDQLRSQRQVRIEGNRRLLVEPDRRMIIRDGGRPYIRHDEVNRFRLLGGTPRLERRGNEQYAYVQRPGGYQIISVTDANGRLLRRIRRGPDGREVVLFNNRRAAALGAGLAAGLLLGLAAPHISIPRERYIVDVSGAAPDMLYDALDAPPLEQLERAYSLDEILQNVELRDRTRRLDVDSITFASGAWEITPEQYPALEAVAHAMKRILARKPNAMFLIEGHTDLVGNEDDNLSLSDRRAEAAAVVLTQVFQVPPENLVTQGYGEQFPKVPTEGANRTNRRVTARNITYLLAGRF
jgi:outer membrane protein OmpA-like peptidoglycan-associated protein